MRLAMEPLRRRARETEKEIARLSKELRALDERLAGTGGANGDSAAVVDGLKRRAELARRIAEAEADWLATEEAIETQSAPISAAR